MKRAIDQRLPTHDFRGLTRRIEIASAFGLVLLHAIDFRSPDISILSRDLLSGVVLQKEIVVEGLYAFVVWIVLSMTCSHIDSIRLLTRSGGGAVLRSLGTLIGSKRSFVVFLMILFQWGQAEFLHSFLSKIHPYAPNFGVLSTLILLLLLTRPPTILVLASSSQGVISLLQRAKGTMRRLRCVALLDSRSVAIPHHAMLPTDNLRTFEFVNWERNVKTLMDHLPLIIVDGRTRSEVVADELSWISGSMQRSRKSVLVTTDEGEVYLSANAKSLAFSVGIQLSTLEELPAVVWGTSK